MRGCTEGVEGITTGVWGFTVGVCISLLFVSPWQDSPSLHLEELVPFSLSVADFGVESVVSELWFPGDGRTAFPGLPHPIISIIIIGYFFYVQKIRKNEEKKVGTTFMLLLVREEEKNQNEGKFLGRHNHKN